MTDNCHESHKLWETVTKRKENMQKLIDQMDKDGIDVLLSPVHPMPAPEHYVTAKIQRKGKL